MEIIDKKNFIWQKIVSFNKNDIESNHEIENYMEEYF